MSSVPSGAGVAEDVTNNIILKSVKTIKIEWIVSLVIFIVFGTTGYISIANGVDDNAEINVKQNVEISDVKKSQDEIRTRQDEIKEELKEEINDLDKKVVAFQAEMKSDVRNLSNNMERVLRILENKQN